MNLRQYSFLKMYQNVLETSKEFKSTWNKLPAFSISLEELQNLVKEIESNRLAQENPSGIATLHKNSFEAELMTIAQKTHGSVLSYGTQSNNPEVIGALKFSASTLTKARDTDQIVLCEILLNLAEKFIQDLEPYGVTNEELVIFRKALEEFRLVIASPRRNILKGKDATLRLKELFIKGNAILKNQMDPLMRHFVDSRFYHQYYSSRKVIYYGQRKTKVDNQV
jgi:hypothetical protein